MTPGSTPRSDLPLRVLLIAAAVTAMTALIVTLDRAGGDRATPAAPDSVAPVVPPAEPIAAEAQVFQMRAGDLATDPAAPLRRSAHLRTLAMFRALRAYPGAPPRIPHGLTSEEIRTVRCRTCHEHGGYSQRFESYAPVTPHPQLTACLQCHLPDARMVGTALPRSGPDALCRQCHAPASEPLVTPELAWVPASWPETVTRRRDGAPPPIPHDLASRGNCLACHMGPGAVAEIRTSHPERADCRECHLTAGDDADVFVRPAPDSAAARGGRQ
jgi:cytochrome c-type protein NapB